MSNPNDFFVAGGTLRLSSESYVLRPADRELLERVQAGEFCYVLTPRQMGKSSLMVRTSERLKQAGHRTALIDLTGTGTTAVTADAWYQGLLTRLKIELRLKVDVQAWWAERQASSVAQRFIEFLRQVVLAQVTEPIAIFIDEIDSTLGLGFSDDFFAAIRYIYNERANDPHYKRLTFVLLGVATPSDLIKDQTRTPFNVGHRIDLQEFSRTDAHILANGLEATYPGYGELILSRIFHWSGGHPYLTQKLCLAAVNALTSTWDEAQVDALVETNFFSDEARNDTNLKFVQSSMQARPEPERRRILQLYQKVYGSQAIRSDERSPVQNYLTLFGLVRVAGGRLHVRNKIYRRVFDQAWIKENMPSNRQQQRAIFASVVALVLVAMTIAVILMRQTPPDIQAQVCRDNFTGATSPAIQMDALACLFNLGPGYDEQARQLFYSLTPTQQKYLFLLDNPQDVGAQVEAVIRGIYVTLDQMENNHDRDLMEAMLKALKEVNRPGTAELTEEIRRWERGRDLADQQQHDQAVISYTLAIEINQADIHPVIHYDRAMAYIELRQYDNALADLERIVVIAHMAPPTPTPTPTKLPATPTPAATSTPTRTSTPTVTPTSGPTDLVGVTPTPTQPPFLPRTPSATSSTLTPVVTQEPTLSNVTISLRFLNADQIIKTVGDTIFQNVELQDQLIRNRASYPHLVEVFGVQVEVTATARVTISATPQLGTTPEVSNPLTSVAFSPDGQTLAIGRWDNSVILWDVSQPRSPVQLGQPLTGHTDSVSSVAFSPDGQTLATGSWDKSVILWDVSQPGSPVRLGQPLIGHTGGVWSVAFSPDGRTLATGSEDNTVILWDVSQPGSPVPLGQPLAGHTGVVSSVAFSPDGRTLAAGSADGSVILWDVSQPGSPKRLGQPLTGHTGGVWSVVFSPDGQTLATGSEDNTVILWDVSQPGSPKRLGQPLTGHKDSVSSAIFSPDGKTLASVSIDGTVILWDVATGQLIGLAKYPNPVYNVTFSPDGRILASSDGNTIILWDVTTEQPVRILPEEVKPAVTQTTEAQATQTALAQTPAASDVFNDFEFGSTWIRGNEPNGTFERSTSQAHSGRYSGQLNYNFPTKGNDYIVFFWTQELAGQPNQLTAWVYGDGSGHYLYALIRDSEGETWKFSFGQVKHTGWQQMAAILDPEHLWAEHTDGPSNGVIDYPITFQALIFDDEDVFSGSGTIYVDDLASIQGVLPPIATFTPEPSIFFQADQTTLNAGDCTVLSWSVENVREVYLDGMPVTGQDRRQVCPGATTTYTLHVVLIDGSSTDFPVTINIGSQPDSTPTPTPTATATPTPTSTPRPATIVYVQSNGLNHVLGIISSEGKFFTQSLHPLASAPTWSPDGTKIAFYGEPGLNGLGGIYAQGSGVWLFEIKSGTVRMLYPAEHIKNMAWSPDGTKLAVEVGPPNVQHQVFMIDTGDGKEISRFPGEQPTWSPDSQEVVIKSCAPECGLWKVGFDGSGGKLLTNDSTDSYPNWSPTGPDIVFTSRFRTGDWEIYRLNTANGKLEQLTNRPGSDTTPVYSSDGVEIYFRTDAFGDWQLRVMAGDGSNERALIDDVGPSDDWGQARPAVY